MVLMIAPLYIPSTLVYHYWWVGASAKEYLNDVLGFKGLGFSKWGGQMISVGLQGSLIRVACGQTPTDDSMRHYATTPAGLQRVGLLQSTPRIVLL